MKTKSEIEKDIIDISTKIHREFPELSSYLKEIPIVAKEDKSSGVTTKSLNGYYNSLVELVSNYINTHISKNSNHDT